MPEKQLQDQDVVAYKKKVQFCRQRYSIFIEPHLNPEKGHFRLHLTIQQFPRNLDWLGGLACDKSFELGYVLKTSDEEKEIISLVDTVQFTDKKGSLLFCQCPYRANQQENTSNSPGLTGTKPSRTAMYIDN